MNMMARGIARGLGRFEVGMNMRVGLEDEDGWV
jgi:hypothetical protein